MKSCFELPAFLSKYETIRMCVEIIRHRLNKHKPFKSIIINKRLNVSYKVLKYLGIIIKTRITNTIQILYRVMLHFNSTYDVLCVHKMLIVERTFLFRQIIIIDNTHKIIMNDYCSLIFYNNIISTVVQTNSMM